MEGTLTKINAMTQTHLNNVMQIMAFRLNDGVLYGINVAKIRSIEDYTRLRLTRNQIHTADVHRFLEGFIQYHGTIVPLLNLECWLGIQCDQSVYTAVIVSEFNRHMISFPVLEIAAIYNIPVEKLHTSHVNRDQVTYSTLLKTEHKQEEVCYIVDVEKFLSEIFDTTAEIAHTEKLAAKSARKVLIAEDSKSAQSIIRQIMAMSDLDYELYDNGRLLCDALDALDEEGLAHIGLVITDIEMPVMDGFQVISCIKKSARLRHLPIVVNTSMSNEGIVKKTMELGASGFIAKTDPVAFLAQIDKHLLR
ncbi:MAG: response regulator [Campylobacterales bacterium]